MATKGRKKGDGRGQNGGGRRPGVTNKITGEMREFFYKFCGDTQEEFVAAYHEIEKPELKCKIWLEAQSFITPKLTSVEMKEKTAGKSLQEELDELEG